MFQTFCENYLLVVTSRKTSFETHESNSATRKGSVLSGVWPTTPFATFQRLVADSMESGCLILNFKIEYVIIVDSVCSN